MMKKFLILSMSLALMVTAFSSCSDENTPSANPTIGSNFNYAVSMSNDKSSQVVVIDSITGNVTGISSSESWLTAVQDGQDGGGHPVLQLTATDVSNKERTAYVTFKSEDGKLLCITVRYSGDTGSNSNGEDLPEVTSLNKAFYENWYQGDNKQVYITVTANKQTWNKYILPWFDNALGSVPSYVVSEMERTKDDWRLVYSTLGLSTTPGANFFTLYNDKLGKFRFFYYIPNEGLSTSSSACFVLELYHANGKKSMALNANETIEMPVDVQESAAVMVSNKYGSENTQYYQLVPIGARNSRTITPGWACFDLLADHGYTDPSKEALEDEKTQFSLRLVTAQTTDVNLLADLSTTGGIDMSGVSLVKKGSDLAAAATFFNGFGSAMSTIGGGIANVADQNKGKNAGGIIQIIGGGSQLVGTCLSTAQAKQDMRINIEGSASVDLKTDGTIKGTLTTQNINGVPEIKFRPINFKYDWATLLSGNPKTRAASSTDLPYYGLLTLTQTPVIYMSADHVLYTPAKYPASYEMDYEGQLIHCVTGDDQELRYISFLDPSSIGVYINKEMMGFDFDRAEISVCVVANVGPHDEYTAPSPYIGYYQLKNDQVQLTTQNAWYDDVFGDYDSKSVKLISCKNTDIPTITKDASLDAKFTVTELPCNDGTVDSQESGFNYRYYGLTGEMFGGNKKIVVDPIIYVPANNNHTFLYNKSVLGPVFVEVCARLFKGDAMQIITKHFQPEIRTFKSSEISAVRNRIQNIPTTIKTNRSTMAADFVDIDWQKSKALKMLELAGK